MRCTVVLSSRSPQIGNGLTYDTGDIVVSKGDLIQAPLRATINEGVVIDVIEAKIQEAFKVKKIQKNLGSLLPPAQLALAQWMADEYRCSVRTAMSVFLPATSWKAFLPAKENMYRRTKSEVQPRGKKQLAIMEYLKSGDWMSESAIRETTGCSPAMLKTLLEKGFVEQSERLEDVQKKIAPHSHDISVEMKKRIQASVGDKRPVLCWMPLSERQEMFAAFINDALSRGRQAIVLYPEVVLAEESAKHFRKLFGEDSVEVLHSRISPTKKKTAWKTIHSGQARIIVGTRTALFAPCRELGLVIIDDEQEWTYKSEETPRYLARPVAEQLCSLASAKLVIGTAVPSVDVFAKIEAKEYAVMREASHTTYHQPSPSLTTYQAGLRPAGIPYSRNNVRLIDLGSTRFGELYPFSPVLLKAVADRLQRKEQSLLLFNRRGAGTALLCEDCRRRVVSRDGNAPLAVHNDVRGLPYLVDHGSGARAPLPDVCPSCKSPRLKVIGAGTQTMENVLKKIFPAATILRADRDSATAEDTEDMLMQLRDKKADILIGTKSIVKSLELPSVTLAAIVLADTGLSVPDFRAGERVFQTIAKLRHLHASKPNCEVIVQTYRPDAPEISLAASGDDERYLREELSLRTALDYPPATRMIRLLFRNPDAELRAKTVAKNIQEQVAKEHGVASASPTFGDAQTWQVLLRSKDPHEVLRVVNIQNAVVDVDPLECA